MDYQYTKGITYKKVRDNGDETERFPEHLTEIFQPNCSNIFFICENTLTSKES